MASILRQCLREPYREAAIAKETTNILELDLDLDARELLVELADLEGRKRLEESGAVVRARRVAHLDHLLRELAVELRRRVREGGLDVDELLEVVELAVHLQDSNVVAEELVGAVGELDARVGAGQLLAARRPLDRRALVEEVGGVEVRLALLLDELDLEDLALLLVGDQVRGQDLDDDVRVAALRRDERVEVA